MIIKAKKNRKLIKQNRRNYLVNHFYINRIRKIDKLLKNMNLGTIQEYSFQLTILNSFYSAFDKAVQKNVIHKNKAARKKKQLALFFNKAKKILTT